LYGVDLKTDAVVTVKRSIIRCVSAWNGWGVHWNDLSEGYKGYYNCFSREGATSCCGRLEGAGTASKSTLAIWQAALIAEGGMAAADADQHSVEEVGATALTFHDYGNDPAYYTAIGSAAIGGLRNGVLVGDSGIGRPPIVGRANPRGRR